MRFELCPRSASRFDKFKSVSPESNIASTKVCLLVIYYVRLTHQGIPVVDNSRFLPIDSVDSVLRHSRHRPPPRQRYGIVITSSCDSINNTHTPGRTSSTRLHCHHRDHWSPSLSFIVRSICDRFKFPHRYRRRSSSPRRLDVQDRESEEAMWCDNVMRCSCSADIVTSTGIVCLLSLIFVALLLVLLSLLPLLFLSFFLSHQSALAFACCHYRHITVGRAQ